MGVVECWWVWWSIIGCGRVMVFVVKCWWVGWIAGGCGGAGGSDGVVAGVVVLMGVAECW